MLNKRDYKRYARHLSLDQVGEQGQIKLKAAKVLLVGLGGLGCPVAQYIVAAGVGRIGLVEFDTVDFSNLQRQILHTENSVATSKIDSAVSRLSELNSDVILIKHDIRVDSNNVMDLVADYDVVVDGTDNFATRYLLNDACFFNGKPYISAAIYKFEGQLAVFNYQEGPCYRCLYPEPPPANLVPNCAEGGVLGVLPGVMGTIQAMETLKIILDIGDVCSNHLLLYDALGTSFRKMKIKAREDCKLCGENPSIKSVQSIEQVCETVSNEDSILEWDVQRLFKAREEGTSLILLDVREEYELQIASLSEVLHIPMGDINLRYSELPDDLDIVVMCRSGKRSFKVCEQLLSLGFERVYNLRGGILDWSDKIDQSIQKY